MALTKCPDCGAEISSSAMKCPQCGRERVGLGGTLFGAAVLMGALFLIIFVALLFGWI